MKPRLVITGAAGGIGAAVWSGLADEWSLCLVDRVPIPVGGAGVETRQADITDATAMREVLDGADALLHLAGNRFPTATWAELLPPNVVGTQCTFAAAAAAGVRRLVVASSCHASGGYDQDRVHGVDPTWPARPCCPYGVTKVHAEVTARYFADNGGPSAVCLRLGAVMREPQGGLAVPFWLSVPDLEQVVRRALVAPIHYGVYYAASANARSRWNLELTERDLGFRPRDDAADHLAGMDLSVSSDDHYRSAIDVQDVEGQT